jgi:CDP-diacylglycerol--serine O-phosphatidyltransferase
MAPAGEIPFLSLLLIGFAMVFDVLDGLAARALNAQSVHGMNLDSMADVTSFGVAPAIIIYRVGIGSAPMLTSTHIITWIISIFYLGCALWRLAQFNTLSIREESDHRGFIGLPSPGAAGLICGMIFMIPELGFDARSSFFIYMVYATLASLLMISTLPYIHIRRCLTSSHRLIQAGLIITVLASIILFRKWALVAWAHLYVLHAPFLQLEARWTQHLHKTRHAGITPRD